MSPVERFFRTAPSLLSPVERFFRTAPSTPGLHAHVLDTIS
jgi:hypothetical protein